MRRVVVVVALAALLGCGGQGAPPEREAALPPVAAAVDPAVAASAAEDHAKDHPDHEALARAEDLAPGDLIVVFANNLDGEIEPCG